MTVRVWYYTEEYDATLGKTYRNSHYRTLSSVLNFRINADSSLDVIDSTGSYVFASFGPGVWYRAEDVT